MRRAVVYYSLSENTKEAAEMIASKIGADIYRIGTKKKMPKSFASQIMFGGLQATFGLKPAITYVPENLFEYDEIILGTPIWAGKHSPAINTLIHKYHIENKVVAVFTLSGGGDNDQCIPTLEKLLPNLKCNVALADKNNEKAAENAALIDSFIEKIS